MTEERLTEEMDKALHDVFDTKQIVDFQFDLVQKAFLKGLEFGMKINKEQAKEIILFLYNAGRDVLMCRNEEKAYSNLENAINDKRIRSFITE